MTFIPGTSTGTIAATSGTIDNVAIGNSTPAAARVAALTNTGMEACSNYGLITTGSAGTLVSTARYVYVSKTTGSPTALTLSPATGSGRLVLIKDLRGDAAINPITILPPTGSLIDGLSQLAINTNYGSAEFHDIGTWTLVRSVGVTISQLIAPATIVESTEGSIVTATNQTIYSSKSNGVVAPIAGPFDTWALTANPGYIIHNSVTDNVNTLNVVQLVYHLHTLYQQNASGAWYAYNNAILQTSTNLLTNSSFTGATTGSPGSMGTNYNSSTAGLTQTIIGTGMDTTTGISIPYCDIRLNGTTNATAIQLNFTQVGPTDGIPITASTNYAFSGYVQLKAGATTNITGFNWLWNESNGPSYVTTQNTVYGPTSSLVQWSTIHLTGASNLLYPTLKMDCASGVAIDITLRIAGLQVTQSSSVQAFVSTPQYAPGYVSTTTPIVTTPTINVGIMTQVAINLAYYVSGTLQGYSTIPTLQYQDNSGSWINFPTSSSVTTTAWSFLHPSMSTVSTNTLTVRDSSTLLTSLVSNTYAIYQPGSITLTSVTLSNSSFTAGAAGGAVVAVITVNAAGGTFSGTLALSGNNAASFAISGSNLVLASSPPPAGTYNITLTATMTGAVGSPLAQAFTITGNAASGLAAPSYASGTDADGNAFAYTTNTFNADFLSASEIATSAGTVANFYNTTGLTSAQLNVSGSICTISGDNSGFGMGLISCANDTAPVSTPTSHKTANGNGILFNLGYFEALIKFDNTISGSSWYPTWFAGSDQTISGGANYFEIDFLEVGSQQAYTAFHEWQPNGGADAHYSPSANVVPSTSLLNYANYNRYGALWNKANITFYYNGTAGPTCHYTASQAVTYHTRARGDFAGDGSTAYPVNNTFGVQSVSNMALMLGAGGTASTTSFPNQIDWVRVWQ